MRLLGERPSIGFRVAFTWGKVLGRTSWGHRRTALVEESNLQAKWVRLGRCAVLVWLTQLVDLTLQSPHWGFNWPREFASFQRFRGLEVYVVRFEMTHVRNHHILQERAVVMPREKTMAEFPNNVGALIITYSSFGFFIRILVIAALVSFLISNSALAKPIT